MSQQKARSALKIFANEKRAQVLQKFFKTGPGEYGEGDIFIGVKVPDIRKVGKLYANLSLSDTVDLLRSKIHEERLLVLLILVGQYKKSSQKKKTEIYNIYLKHTDYINNWDLVDVTAAHIVGDFLLNRAKKQLFILARSAKLWERRIAVVATHAFIRNNCFKTTLEISRILLKDEHNLIHKAVGWTLREAGKRDAAVLEGFLDKHAGSMPRTMLRYAIEKLPLTQRQRYLMHKKKIT